MVPACIGVCAAKAKTESQARAAFETYLLFRKGITNVLSPGHNGTTTLAMAAIIIELFDALSVIEHNFMGLTRYGLALLTHAAAVSNKGTANAGLQRRLMSPAKALKRGSPGRAEDAFKFNWDGARR